MTDRQIRRLSQGLTLNRPMYSRWATIIPPITVRHVDARPVISRPIVEKWSWNGINTFCITVDVTLKIFIMCLPRLVKIRRVVLEKSHRKRKQFFATYFEFSASCDLVLQCYQSHCLFSHLTRKILPEMIYNV